MSLERQSVLQLSLRRAGSTTLYRAVTAHPSIGGPEEFWSFHTRNNAQKPGYFDRTDPMSPINFSQAGKFHPLLLHEGMEGKPTETWWLHNITSFFESNSAALPTVRYAKETFANLHLGLLLTQLLPTDLKVVHLRRDLRGIIASYKENNLYQRWHVENIYDQLAQTIKTNSELADRYRQLFTVPVENRNWLDILTRKLIFFQSELERHVLDFPQHYTVEFRSFLQDAKKEVSGLFNWLSIPVTPEVLHHAERMTREDNKQTGNLHPLYQWRHPDDWVSILSLDEQKRTEDICAQYGMTLSQINRELAKEEIKKHEEKKQAVPSQRRYQTFQHRDILLKTDTRQQVVQQISDNLVSESTDNNLYISKYLVTNNQFEVFLNWLSQQNIEHNQLRYLFYNPARGMIKNIHGVWKSKEHYEQHPIVSVTWLGALAFATWIGARLPSYEEWNKAYGEGVENNTRSANYDQQTGGVTPIGMFHAHRGLYDMLGNVREWTDTSASDESIFTPGGSWQDTDVTIKQHNTRTNIATLSDRDLGFRVASSTKKLELVNDNEIRKRILSVLNILSSEELIYLPLKDSYEKVRKIMNINLVGIS